MLDAWDISDHDRANAIASRLDRAVSEGLRLLMLPRGVSARLAMAEGQLTWLAKWVPAEHTILLSDVMARAQLLLPNGSDTVFRALVHESLHARSLPTMDAIAEDRSVRGYEEGLVDGLADLLVREKALMSPDP